MNKLTNDNFLLYAIKHYDNPSCTDMAEFNNDLKHIKYIKRWLNRYKTTGFLKERVLLNHIIIIYNLFGPEAATKILFFRIEKQYWPELKTFLEFLNFMPEKIENIDDAPILSSSIPLNINIVHILRKI